MVLELASRLIVAVVAVRCGHARGVQAVAARRRLRGALHAAEFLPRDFPVAVLVVEVPDHLLEECLDLVLVDEPVLVRVHVGEEDGQRRPILDADVHDLDVEMEGSPRRDDLPDVLVAVGQRRRNHEIGFGALAEADDPDVPAIDDVSPADLKVEGHPPVAGRIDLAMGRTGGGGPVDGSHVVHLDVVPRLDPIGLGAVGRAVVHGDRQ
mmetsp:Transcript_2841/g.7800  ORF Transcript_2841/g.7800 Transcript_2841/m.7800 type:complete len:209 (-) Transcript_2841:208-834(-)